MKIITTTLVAVCLTLGTFGAVTAEQRSGVNVGAELPPKIRGLLIKEMLGIDAASQQILSALAQGQHALVAAKAQQIHDSFILAQEMSAEDEQILHDTVPEGFLALDTAFHGLSDSLAEAARSEDSERQLQEFTKLTQACVACHSQYATERFPGLQP